MAATAGGGTVSLMAVVLNEWLSRESYSASIARISKKLKEQ